LSRATLLAHPNPSVQLALVTDASTNAMGAVLKQRVGNAWQPLAFFSRKLNPAQQKYSAYDRELLALYEAVKHFRHILEARHFVIFTDHKPITYAFQQKRDKCSPRQYNHLDFVEQFTTDMRHISGQDNVVANALSRVESITVTPSPDALAVSQEDDGELRALLASDTALRLEKQQMPGTAVSIYCDTSAGKPRLYVPGPLRLQVFQSVHDVSSRHKDNSTAGCRTFRVARHPKRWLHLGTGLPGLPALQSIPPHSRSSGRLHAACSPFPARSRRPRGDSPNIGRPQVLPHCGRPFHALARSNSNPRHYSGDRGTRPRRRLDIPFWFTRRLSPRTRDVNSSRNSVDSCPGCVEPSSPGQPPTTQ
jgi:hypothetical protein